MENTPNTTEQLKKIDEIDQNVSKMKEDQITLIASQKAQLKEQIKIYSSMKDSNSKQKVSDMQKQLQDLDIKQETVTGKNPKSLPGKLKKFTSIKAILGILIIVIVILFIIQVFVIINGFSK